MNAGKWVTFHQTWGLTFSRTLSSAVPFLLLSTWHSRFSFITLTCVVIMFTNNLCLFHWFRIWFVLCGLICCWDPNIVEFFIFTGKRSNIISISCIYNTLSFLNNYKFKLHREKRRHGKAAAVYSDKVFPCSSCPKICHCRIGLLSHLKVYHN